MQWNHITTMYTQVDKNEWHSDWRHSEERGQGQRWVSDKYLFYNFYYLFYNLYYLHLYYLHLYYLHLYYLHLYYLYLYLNFLPYFQDAQLFWVCSNAARIVVGQSHKMRDKTSFGWFWIPISKDSSVNSLEYICFRSLYNIHHHNV